METSIFLNSAVAALVTAVVLLSPSLIVSFVLLRFIAKQRVTKDYPYSNSTNGRPTEVPDYHSSDLPLDIVIDILSRLTVKTLCRFKCVSKHWNEIISTSPYLVSMHIIRNQQASNQIICNYDDPYNRNGDRRRTVVLSSPDDPLPVDCDHDNVVCSSGDLGVLLLGSRSQSDYSLWNPATRQVKHLPQPPPFEPRKRTTYSPNHPEEDKSAFPRLQRSDDYCGVGLDLVANVVKVVLVRNFAIINKEAPVFELMAPVYVYTVGGGWRKLTGDCPYRDTLCWPTHFKGSIYWYSCLDRGSSRIIIFDLATEVFRKVDCPTYDLNNRSLFGPYVYRDSVAVFANECMVDAPVDVWLMSSSNEEAGELRWIKHSSVGPFPRPVLVRGCWDDNKILAMPGRGGGRDFMAFDTLKQELKVVIPDVVFMYGLFTYKETLVCIQ